MDWKVGVSIKATPGIDILATATVETTRQRTVDNKKEQFHFMANEEPLRFGAMDHRVAWYGDSLSNMMSSSTSRDCFHLES